MPRRLNRQQQQEQTRRRLLASAAKVFARRGIDGASVDDVAADAGYTKGAVYANFAGKDALFLALVEDHYERWEARARAAGEETDTLEDGAGRAGEEYMSYLAEDPSWPRLFIEFWLYASRRPKVRKGLVARNEELRGAIAGLIERELPADAELPCTLEELGRMTYAMGNGVAMEMALEPENLPPDLFAKMLRIFLAGLAAGGGEGRGRGRPDP